MRMQHGATEAVGNREPDHIRPPIVERMRARQNESAIEGRRDIVRVSGAAACNLGLHRALEQDVERRGTPQELVRCNEGGHGAAGIWSLGGSEVHVALSSVLGGDGGSVASCIEPPTCPAGWGAPAINAQNGEQHLAGV